MKYRVLALLIALFLYYFTHHDLAHAEGEVSNSDTSTSQASSIVNESAKSTPSLGGNVLSSTTRSITNVVQDTVKGTTDTLDKTVDNVSSTVKDTTNQVSTTVDQATADATTIVKDVADLPANVIKEVDQAAQGQSSDVVGSVTATVDQTVNNVTDTVQHTVQNTTNTVTGVLDSTVKTVDDTVTSVVDTTTTVIPEIVPVVPDVPVTDLPPIVPQLPVDVKPIVVPDDSVTPMPSKDTTATHHSQKNSTQGDPDSDRPTFLPVQPAVPSVHIATQSPSTEAVQSSTINESNDKDSPAPIPSIPKPIPKNVPTIPSPLREKVQSVQISSHATALPIDEFISNGTNSNALATETSVEPETSSQPVISDAKATQPVSPSAAIWLDVQGVQGLVVANSSSSVEGSGNSNPSHSQNVFVNHRLANWKHYRIHLLTYRAQSEHGSNQWTHAPPGQPPQEAPYFI